MNLAELNALPRHQAEEAFLKCCGSTAWAKGMSQRRPFASFDVLVQTAGEIWRRLDRADWMEAFRAHPQIGQLQSNAHTSTQAWSAREQSGISHAAIGVITGLEEANREYLAKFGHIFIVCASGKSADQMLALLQSRLLNSPEQEIRVAANEQDKITRLRLAKLLTA